MKLQNASQIIILKTPHNPPAVLISFAQCAGNKINRETPSIKTSTHPDIVTDNYEFFSEITVKEVKLQGRLINMHVSFWGSQVIGFTWYGFLPNYFYGERNLRLYNSFKQEPHE